MFASTRSLFKHHPAANFRFPPIWPPDVIASATANKKKAESSSAKVKQGNKPVWKREAFPSGPTQIYVLVLYSSSRAARPRSANCQVRCTLAGVFNPDWALLHKSCEGFIS